MRGKKFEPFLNKYVMNLLFIMTIYKDRFYFCKNLLYLREDIKFYRFSKIILAFNLYLLIMNKLVLAGRRDLRVSANSVGRQESKNRNFKLKNIYLFYFLNKNSIFKLSVARRVNRDPQILAARPDRFGIIYGFSSM
jgi:hypothetical protein